MEKIVLDESLCKILEVISEGVGVVTKDLKIIFWNKGAEKITGYSSEEVLSSACCNNILGYSNILGENLGFEREPLQEIIGIKEEEEGKEIFLKRKDKKTVRVSIKSMALQVGEEEYEVEIFKKLQFSTEEEGPERRKQEKEEAVVFDPLTGLYSRGYIDTILEQQYRTFKRHSQRFGFVMIEVDKFKDINDNFGHLVGDEVLKFVASVLKHAIRSSDSLARFGEDEFIIVCPNTELGGVEKLSERIVGLVHYSVLALSEKLTKTVKVSVSIGAATVDYKDKSVLEAITRAKEALSRVKREGGNWYALG